MIESNNTITKIIKVCTITDGASNLMISISDYSDHSDGDWHLCAALGDAFEIVPSSSTSHPYAIRVFKDNRLISIFDFDLLEDARSNRTLGGALEVYPYDFMLPCRNTDELLAARAQVYPLPDSARFSSLKK
jgi:hypothetical protein